MKKIYLLSIFLMTGLLSWGQSTLFWANNGINNQVDGCAFFGTNSGIINSGYYNTFLGVNAGTKNTTGEWNVFIGHAAGLNNVSGGGNIIIGRGAGYENTTGSYNTFIGQYTGRENVSGHQNTFVGEKAGQENVSGGDNVFLGNIAGRNNDEGDANTYLGVGSGHGNHTGDFNVAVGLNAAHENESGNRNTSLGHDAGYNNKGDLNLFLGHKAGYNESGSNKLYIDNSTTPTPLIWGDFFTNELNFNANVGIGVSQPTARLHVDGKVRIVDGSQKIDRVLTSNDDGTATWKDSNGGEGIGWSITGNSNTTDANFIGTINKKPFNIRVNNENAGKIDPISYNSFYGYKSGNSNTGFRNTGFGHWALEDNTTGSGNTASGVDALQHNTIGDHNTGIGRKALQSNISGDNNTGIGVEALHKNETGENNTGIGYMADVNSADLFNATALGARALVTESDAIQLGDGAVEKVFVGTGNTPTLITGQLQVTGGNPQADQVLQSSDATGLAEWKDLNVDDADPDPNNELQLLKYDGDLLSISGKNTVYIGVKTQAINGNTLVGQDAANGHLGLGSNNTMSGFQAGLAATNPESNSFFGANAGKNTTSGKFNTYIGSSAGENNIDGQDNVFIGGEAGFKNGIGDKNVFIGKSAGYNELGSSKLYIDNGELSNPLVYGNFADGQLAIGTKDESIMSNYTLTINGTGLITGGMWQISDRKFKKNEKAITNGMQLVDQLKGLTYEYKAKEVAGRKFNKGIQYGFVAQEVKEVLPELVSEGADGYMTVNYIGVIPVLVEALKEQNSAVKVLQVENATMAATIENLTKKMTILEKSFATQSESDTSESFDVLNTEAILHQNVPNPFTTSTVIQYELPETVRTAQIIVYDLQGHQLKAFEDLKAGQGRVEIAGSTLKAGMYVYTLLANGKVINTKRMILTK